jgi:hypothetical protein
MAARSPPALVDEPVVRVAEQDEVVEIRPAAPGPVHQVVRFQPSFAFASREPARLIAMAKDPADGSRDGSSSSPDADRAALPLQDPLDTSVAGEAPHALRAQALSRFRFGEPGSVGYVFTREHRCIGVHDERGSTGPRRPHRP